MQNDEFYQVVTSSGHNPPPPYQYAPYRSPTKIGLSILVSFGLISQLALGGASKTVCERIVNFDRIEYPNIIRMQYFIESNIRIIRT